MMGDAVPQTPWDLSLLFSRMDVFPLLQTAPAVQSRGLIGRQTSEPFRQEPDATILLKPATFFHCSSTR
jgi:hypothetical protein